ncbi:17424_t:CDS:2 [Entrophospora sp. SA101]|nr:17424_t:CDS:2 [Entrophospora sp. SA101]
MSTSVSTTTEPQLYFEARITEDSVKRIKEIIKKEINDFEEVDELTIKVKPDELTFSYILHCMITETIDTDWGIPVCNNLLCVEYSSEILKHIIEGIHKYTREIRLTFHPDATSIESVKNPYDRHRAKRIFPRSNFTIYNLMQPVNCTVLRKTFKVCN